MGKKDKQAQPQQQQESKSAASTAADSGSTDPPPAPIAASDPAPASADSVKVTQESRVLDDKLAALKDQISDLRSSIKNFETELDARLDACFKSILAKKGAESGVV